MDLISLTLAFLLASDAPSSGPKVGEKLSSFKVLALSGPQAGKDIELVEAGAKGPTLLIFVHYFDRPAFRCLKPVDIYAGQLAEHKLTTHIIWLSDDLEKTRQFLERAKNSLNLRSAVGISRDGPNGPKAYALSDRVTYSILLAQEGKVVANLALVGANDTDAPRVLAAIAKVMGKKAPTVQELLQP